MLLDIGFFDDAVPTSTMSRRPRPEAGDAAAAAAAADRGAARDVPDYASVVASLKKKIPYRYVASYVLVCTCISSTCIDLFYGVVHKKLSVLHGYLLLLLLFSSGARSRIIRDQPR